jgi:hypothetical protein
MSAKNLDDSTDHESEEALWLRDRLDMEEERRSRDFELSRLELEDVREARRDLDAGQLDAARVLPDRIAVGLMQGERLRELWQENEELERRLEEMEEAAQKSLEQRKHFFIIERDAPAISWVEGLSLPALGLLLQLAMRANRVGEIYTTQKRLAASLESDPKTIRARMAELETRGIARTKSEKVELNPLVVQIDRPSRCHSLAVVGEWPLKPMSGPKGKKSPRRGKTSRSKQHKCP